MEKVVFMLICGNEACDDFIWFGEAKLRPTPAPLPGELTNAAFELMDEAFGDVW